MPTLTSYNPVDHSPVGDVPLTAPDDIPALVARARGAQPRLGRARARRPPRPAPRRRRRMVDAAERVGRQLTREMGKPLREGIGEVRYTGAGLADENSTWMVDALRSHEVVDRHTRSTLSYRPLGVCAAIAPWNFPFSMPHWMVLPALMAGNTVVLKPSKRPR
ncbi:MAG: aldehyde dehydrogenase family protein [bacterium]